MKRLTALLAAIVMLSGCVIHETYREPYYGDGRSGGGYYGPSGADYYEGDGYYGDAYSYENGYSGGDYYYGYDSGYGYGVSSSWYVEYPYYYSLFWPLNYWYADPYWYPNYYYGVTWFPRNYLSIGLSYGYWPHRHYGYLAYSPYRYSWVDNYYDYRPWHGRTRPHYDYDRYYPLPRYGSAHNEAERLAAVRRVQQRPVAGVNRPGAYPNPSPRTNSGVVGATNRTPANSGARSADYRSSVQRQDPGVRVFDDNRRTDPRVTTNPRGNVNPNASGTTVRQPTSAAAREADRIATTNRQPLPVRSSGTEAARPTQQPGYGSRELPQRSGAGSSVPPRSVERITPAPSVSANPGRAATAPRPTEGASAPVRSSAPAVVRTAPRPVQSQQGERVYSQPRTSVQARPAYTASPAPERAQPVSRAPAAPVPSYSAPAPAQTYSAPQRQSAPSYPAPSRQQSYSAPEPSRSSSSESSSSRGSDGGSSSSGRVRRVGSNRD